MNDTTDAKPQYQVPTWETAVDWQARMLVADVERAVRGIAADLWDEAQTPRGAKIDRLRAIEDAARAVVDGGTFDYTFTPEQKVLIDALREALR